MRKILVSFILPGLYIFKRKKVYENSQKNIELQNYSVLRLGLFFIMASAPTIIAMMELNKAYSTGLDAAQEEDWMNYMFFFKYQYIIMGFSFMVSVFF